MADVVDERAKLLSEGRARIAARAWQPARDALVAADGVEPLGASDLEQLAETCYLLGDDDGFFVYMERAYGQRMEASEPAAAVRCAFWSGMQGMLRGEVGKAGGWFGRAGRLLAELGDCAEQGYMLLARFHQLEAEGELVEAERTAAKARAHGAQHGDRVLEAVALHQQGRALLELGSVAEGLSALDEVMLTVTGDGLPPRITGLLYCSVIEGCQSVQALGRSAEWTEALRGWCDAQPDMLSFTGKCLIHRAEILQLGGAWEAAIVETQRACERIERGPRGGRSGAALYQEAEVRRMRGELSAAEATYDRAAQCGADPQPGLALLRLRQGERKGAAASIARVLDAARGDIARCRVLPAYVEIMLAADRFDEARAAADELDAIAERFCSGMTTAQAMQWRGAVQLAAGQPADALGTLARALSAWELLCVPYEAARTQALLAEACAAAGDEDGRRSHAQAAQAQLARLGAVSPRASAGPGSGALSGRELEVLRLVASGKTNREIAKILSLSVKTIDRHVSNILAKLDVASRAAATAYAYENDLL